MWPINQFNWVYRIIWIVNKRHIMKIQHYFVNNELQQIKIHAWLVQTCSRQEKYQNIHKSCWVKVMRERKSYSEWKWNCMSRPIFGLCYTFLSFLIRSKWQTGNSESKVVKCSVNQVDSTMTTSRRNRFHSWILLSHVKLQKRFNKW